MREFSTVDEEATLSYRGATLDLEPDARPTMILDIGGGSTELALMHDGTLFEFLHATGLRASEPNGRWAAASWTSRVTRTRER